MRYLKMGRVEPEFPELLGHDYILNWLFDLGPLHRTPEGNTGLPHTEIQAWARNRNMRFRGPEADWLYLLSKVYFNEFYTSDGVDTPQPFVST